MTVKRYPDHADANWSFDVSDRNMVSWEACHAVILMDIREQLRTLNRLLGCSRFTGIPDALAAIRRNTTRRRRKPKAVRP